MTAWPDVTVAILSHRRRTLLRRVLGAVAQLDYPAFEIVVVGDQPDLQDYDLDPAIARQVRYRRLIAPNISRGRNMALGMAAGRIVAFCDDDAAPEPDWLRVLAGAFRRADVAAASGTVLASDGLTVEWQGRYFASSGRDVPAELPPDGLLFADPESQTANNRYLGLIGANSAFRRDAVLNAGGFDEAFEYFLEETDMALRLAQNGWSAAFAPGAVVHHLRAQNAARGATPSVTHSATHPAANVPRNLFQIAASKAHFCQRHMQSAHVADELARFRADRLRGLDRHLRLGTLRAEGLRRLGRQLDRGLAAGARRPAVLPWADCPPSPALAPFRAPGPALRIALVSGWGTRVGRTRHLARRLADAGHLVSCFAFAAGLHPARVTFADGLWLHRAGTWRLNPLKRAAGQAAGRDARALAEVDRVARHRRFDVILRPGHARDDADGLAIDLALPGDLGPMTARPPAGSPAIPDRTLLALERALENALKSALAAGPTAGPRTGTDHDAAAGGTATQTHNPAPDVFRIPLKGYDFPDAPLGHG